MFFIVPSVPKATTPPPRKSAKLPKLYTTDESESTNYYRRRVPTACDRCRLKKARCSGGDAPCRKCKRDGVICVISKARTVDLKPKAPGYVKMVESQRDLLLRAVHELRQRYNSSHAPGDHLDSSLDMNSVLEELNIQMDDTEDLSQSILQELSLPQTIPKDITNPEIIPDISSLDFMNLEKLPWVDTTSIETPSPTATANHEVHTPINMAMETNGLSDPSYFQDNLLDTYQFNDKMLPTEWASADDDAYFSYDMNSAVSSFMDTDTLQQQIWQNGEMEFLDRGVMQDVL